MSLPQGGSSYPTMVLRETGWSSRTRRKTRSQDNDPHRAFTLSGRVDVKYVSYTEASAAPNVIVDGSATKNTVLTLSHWPKSGTPAHLKADTSAEIVFRYLDQSLMHADASVVSNNHYDEDGLVGIFTLAVTRPARSAGMDSRTIEKTPAFSSTSASFARRSAASESRACGRKPPS